MISAFDYKELILIDDGIGTPVILKHPDFYNSTLKYKLKNILLKAIYPFFLRNRFKIVTDFINDIRFYYTIYSFKSYIPSEEINIFKESIRVLTGVKCIIGQPLVELGLVTKEKYTDFLKKIIRREGSVIYYGHPMESFLKTVFIEGMVFIENKLPVEKSFEENGIPEYVFSFYSSSLLHLKKQNPGVKIFYIKNNFSISSSSIFESYEMFFEQVAISKYAIELMK